ncbi:hypothetical protein [Spelaeicoccus albus]|uniref:Na+/melibiose symporter-like transporter n=1 Tax=Spelaeicoccus albus TaxID=1280376 RepID=A0A7Z0II02_9MICO|nr:hypothetical protein [Spelaeicoccus albus]NYI68001.1 Na+/melibiose symporter-like transporter [Spelaeicoccus albus]
MNRIERARASSRRQFLDVLIGFVGFFGIVVFVATVAAEITGRPALSWALGLLGIVAVELALVTARRRTQ